MQLTKEARAARAAYMREWRKKNPEKQREYDAAKWERKAAAAAKEKSKESEASLLSQAMTDCVMIKQVRKSDGYRN